MKKILSTLFLCGFMLPVAAEGNGLLKGYQYADVEAPDGKEWESPERIALNKEQPHAVFYS
ncbi:hypothetical protein, partial [uncultured Bacteroides sp.]